MSDFTQPFTFEDKIRAATKIQIPLPSQAFQARLSEQLFTQAISNPKWYGRLTIKSVSPIQKITLALITLVLITFFIMGPQKVLAAIQNILRYLPNIGFVETDRLLTAPVTIEREEISLTVKSMAVTEEETVLVYYVQNLPIGDLEEYCETHKAADPGFECLPVEPTYQLRTNDGTIYEGHPTGGFTSDKHDGTDWTGQIGFPSLPADILQVEFILDVLPNIYPDMAPEDWVIPLSLETANGGDQLPIVYQPEFATVTPEVTTPPQETDSPEPVSTPAVRDEVELLLNAVSIEENTLTLSINVLWENENWYMVEILDFLSSGTVPKGSSMPHYVTLIDAYENQIPLVFNQMESPYTDSSEKIATFVFSGDITGQEITFPLTLTLSNINVTGSFGSKENQPSFLFTPATALQPGDCEEISNSVIAFDNLVEFIKICSVENPGKINMGGGGSEDIKPTPQYGLELYIRKSSNLLSATVGDKDCQREENRPQENCGDGYSIFTEQDAIIDGQLYTYQPPTWPVEYAITGIEYVLSGPWSIQFDLSELTETPSATDEIDQGDILPSGFESAHLVGETIPDGTILEAGQEFIKTFTLENAGGTTWNAEYQIIFYASPQGETLESPQSILLNKEVNPGEEVIVSIPLTAPQSEGSYTIVWQLANSNGGVINVDGGNIWISIQVGGENAGGPAASANGVAMYFSAIIPGPTETRIDLCFDLPTGNNWFPGRAKLISGGIEYQGVGAGPIGTYPFTCFYVLIEIGNEELYQNTSYQLVLEKMTNGQTVDNSLEICEQIKPELKAQYLGLDFTCLPFSAGAYYSNLVIPPGFSELEIGIIISDTIEGNIIGPWIITITP